MPSNSMLGERLPARVSAVLGLPDERDVPAVMTSLPGWVDEVIVIAEPAAVTDEDGNDTVARGLAAAHGDIVVIIDEPVAAADFERFARALQRGADFASGANQPTRTASL